MSRLTSWRYFELALVAFLLVLTLSTAYIHYWVGGIMLLLNALGYVGLATLLVGSFVLYRRALPLVMLALAGYAAVTIIGWVIMGPYFDVAYLAKAIEVVLITTIALYLWRTRSELSEAISWGLTVPGMALRRIRGR